MIARFDWQIRPAGGSLVRSGRRARFPSLFPILAALTLLLATWLPYRYLLRPPWLALTPALAQELLNLLQTAILLTTALLWLLFWWRTRRRLAAPMPTLSAGEMYALSPAGFEQYVGGLFAQKGYLVRVRGRSGDHGVDLELVDDGGRRAIVQCKRYRNTVGPEVVRELYGTLVHERAAHGFLVTTGEISDGAREWAANKPLTLIDGLTLADIAATIGSRG